MSWPRPTPANPWRCCPVGDTAVTQPGPGWWPDPTRRHLYRYWNGAQWTDHVADGGPTRTDPLVPTAVVGSSAPVAPARERDPVPVGPIAAFQSSQFGRWPRDPDPDPTDVLPRRIVAFVIDAAVCLAVAVLLVMTLAPGYTQAETNERFSCDPQKGFVNPSSCERPQFFRIGNTWYDVGAGDPGVPFLVFTFVYWAVAERLLGATLGKWLLGLHVVSLSGRRVGLGRTTIRWALLFIDGPLTFFLCGLITSSSTNGHQRLGDRWSDSYVVGRDAVGKPLTLPE
jgi:uncharacterized RDD family membrane protein YckC